MGTVMSKKVAGLFIVLASMATTSSFAAEASIEKCQAVNLAGTTWSGSDSDGENYTFTFRTDGTILYKSDKETIEKGE
jgi:hypothetical protein